MKLLTRYLLWFILLAAALPMMAAEKHMPAFTIHLEGVKFGYPGFEHWAEIERPDGKHEWAFAIFQGKDSWRVPFQADIAGVYRILQVERRRGDTRENDTIGKDSQLELDVKKIDPFSGPTAVQKDLVSAGEFKNLYYMFVCVGDRDSHSRYQIHLLTSPPLGF